MLTSCVDSCTRCHEGPEGVGKPRSREEQVSRRDSFCGDLDDDCRARVEAGGCHDGSDTILRCPGSCRVCRFRSVVEEVYKCGTGFLSSLSLCESRRKRCARPPDMPPAVSNPSIGGVTIDSTMRRIMRDFPQYEPRAISQPGGPHGEHAPWVVTLSNFVSDEEAAAFINGCANHFSRSLAGDVLSPVRTSSQCWCSNNACERDPMTQRVAHRIANLTQVPSELYFEPFQILKYMPGQFYKVHHDQNSGLFTPQGPRVYTFFMYLSTPEKGGGTRFADIGTVVPAVKGSAVLWPSVMNADPEKDEPMTNHEGMPPDVGIKYAANVWGECGRIL